MRKKLKLLGLIFGGIIIGLIAAEISVRVLYPSADGLYMPDSRAFYKLIPAWSGRPVISGQSFKVNINKQGMRGIDKMPRMDGGDQILCMGDSFTFGLGVDDNEAFPAQLERILGDPYEVHNGGVAGYNLSQEYSRLLEVGGNLKPEYVILGVFANDWEDLGYTTYLPNEEGNLVIAPRSMRAHDFNAGRIHESWEDVAKDRRSRAVELLLKSRTAEMVYTRLFYMKMARTSQDDADGVAPGSWQRLGNLTRELMLGKSAQQSERAWSNGSLLIEGMNAVVKGWDGKFIVMYIPMEEQLSRTELDHLYDRLKRRLKINSIPFLDLLPSFREMANPGNFYLAGDGHLNEKGNGEVAFALANFINQLEDHE